MKQRIEDGARWARAKWHASACLQNETWRWGILAVLLLLLAIFGGK